MEIEKNMTPLLNGRTPSPQNSVSNHGLPIARLLRRTTVALSALFLTACTSTVSPVAVRNYAWPSGYTPVLDSTYLGLTGGPESLDKVSAIYCYTNWDDSGGAARASFDSPQCFGVDKWSDRWNDCKASLEEVRKALVEGLSSAKMTPLDNLLPEQWYTHDAVNALARIRVSLVDPATGESFGGSVEAELYMFFIDMSYGQPNREMPSLGDRYRCGFYDCTNATSGLVFTAESSQKLVAALRRLQDILPKK